MSKPSLKPEFPENQSAVDGGFGGGAFTLPKLLVRIPLLPKRT